MASTIDADDLDLDHTPRRRRDLIEVVVDGQATIYEPDGGAKHRLNPVATGLWHCIDGSVTVRQLCEDMRDVFGGDTEKVQADVLGYVRRLGSDGLLVGVERADGQRRSELR